MPAKPLSVLLIGAGNRGAEVYGEWILANPDQLQITAVAEPLEARRTTLAKSHAIPINRQFASWQEALAGNKLADVAIVATQDQLHTAPTLKALELGYDVLLEKPMAHRLEDCVALVQAAEKHGRLLQIAHVLRYTNFFQQVYDVVNTGRLGQIITVSHRENVSAWHMAHSFVRGNWRRADHSSPMILAKSCHDLDLLNWTFNSPVKTLSSTGGLRHYRPENAPTGAPQRCLDGCPAADTCPFFAPALYVDLEPILESLSHERSRFARTAGKLMQTNPSFVRRMSKVIPSLRQITEYRGWPRSVITEDPINLSAVQEALENGPYGRCVYHCDNDVVDHQIVLMALENGVSVSFTMHGHSFEEGRTIRVDGSQATLLGKFSWNETFIEIRSHRGGKSQRLDLSSRIEDGGHGGGDHGLMRAFTDALNGRPQQTLTDARSALESHLLAFAAEQARTTNAIIDMAEYRREAEKSTN